MSITSIPAVPIRTKMYDEKGNLTRTWILFFESLGASGPGSSSGLLAEIPGMYSLANLRGLRLEDAGYTYRATDYAHTYVWNGTGWEFATGDDSGFIVWRVTAPLIATGWKLADGTGSPVTYARSDGTTGSIALPDIRGKYPKGAAVYTGAAVATAGTITGSTAAEATHTHAIDHDHPSAGTGAPGSLVALNFMAGGSVLNVASAHGHQFDMPALVQASGAGSSHVHTVGTLALSAVEPAHVDLLPYFRL